VMLKDDSPNAPYERSQSFSVGVGQPVVLKPQTNAVTAAACVGGLLVPGLGHLILGRWARGALLLISVLLMFILGLSMHGALVPPPVPGELVSFRTLNAFANAGTGLPYVIAIGTGQGAGVPTEQTADYGWLFLVVAGLLNYLIVFDAFDIARGRKP
jgi:hypothetical protein